MTLTERIQKSRKTVAAYSNIKPLTRMDLVTLKKTN